MTKSRICLFLLAFLLIFLSIVPFFRRLPTEYSVNFDVRVGSIKPLNGSTLWAKLAHETLDDRQTLAEACHFSTVRLCDAPWDNEGLRLVDVNQVFANLNADPNNPDNYFFAATDDYIANILKGGAVPIYRLGTSHEETKTRYFSKSPQNLERYAEICAGIVRHYNAGWANGFEWKLPYWEIWNEPDRPESWENPNWEQYCRFYLVVAKRLRAEFPDIKIGGPSLSIFDEEKIKRLVQLCKEENAPLDFVSWHRYSGTPELIIDEPYSVRKTLDELGYANTEIHLNEWHYLPMGREAFFNKLKNPQQKVEMAVSPDGLNSVEAAAFIDYVLTRWQDGPLDMCNYYAFGLDMFGMIDYFGRIRPTYYAFLLFGEQIFQAPTRVETKDPGANVSLLGSVDETGTVKRLLVSCYKMGNPKPIVISLQGVPKNGKAEVAQIDYDSDYKVTTVKYFGGNLRLEPQKSSVFLVRFCN